MGFSLQCMLNMGLDLQSLFGLLCTAVLIGSDNATPPPAFGLIYGGANGQPRQTTSLCDPLYTAPSRHRYTVPFIDGRQSEQNHRDCHVDKVVDGEGQHQLMETFLHLETENLHFRQIYRHGSKIFPNRNKFVALYCKKGIIRCFLNFFRKIIQVCFSF